MHYQSYLINTLLQSFTLPSMWCTDGHLLVIAQSLLSLRKSLLHVKFRLFYQANSFLWPFPLFSWLATGIAPLMNIVGQRRGSPVCFCNGCQPMWTVSVDRVKFLDLTGNWSWKSNRKIKVNVWMPWPPRNEKECCTNNSKLSNNVQMSWTTEDWVGTLHQWRSEIIRWIQKAIRLLWQSYSMASA